MKKLWSLSFPLNGEATQLTLVYSERIRKQKKKRRESQLALKCEILSFPFSFSDVFIIFNRVSFFWWDRYINYCINKRWKRILSGPATTAARADPEELRGCWDPALRLPGRRRRRTSCFSGATGSGSGAWRSRWKTTRRPPPTERPPGSTAGLWGWIGNWANTEPLQTRITAMGTWIYVIARAPLPCPHLSAFSGKLRTFILLNWLIEQFPLHLRPSSHSPPFLSLTVSSHCFCVGSPERVIHAPAAWWCQGVDRLSSVSFIFIDGPPFLSNSFRLPR